MWRNSSPLDPSHLTAVTAGPASKLRWDKVFASFARAVLAGRDGRAEEAKAAVADALLAAKPYPMARNLGLRLVAEAALDDGWGAPREWLRQAERFFRDVGVPAVSEACRELARRTRRHRTGQDELPPHVRSAGITLREFEVLRLIGQRLRNREIADRLHVSERTVETHVSSLLAKTGLSNRIELSKFATDE
jgi:DNA-binding CsgD family transcriptional regulator